MLRTDTTAAAQWPVWTTTARVVVTHEEALVDARILTEAQLTAIDKACSRFRADSELRACAGATTTVSPLLADLVATALKAAEDTDGDVDPTVAIALAHLGYDRDLSDVEDQGKPIVSRKVPGWQRIRLDHRLLTIPRGIELDLGATAKAFAADRSARLIANSLRVGVLVSLGGDIATAGPPPPGGWRVLVQDQLTDPSCAVAIPAGTALATSSTSSRTWRQSGKRLHHILNPRTGLPAEPVWRSVTVAAHSCVKANTATTAALVRGAAAPAWLRSLRLPARLVRADGEVLTMGGWPE
jgi:thiamine biosynthesis lipoprotein